MTTDATALVREFCAAFGKGATPAELVDYFTDDAVYHNIPVEPAIGPEAIKAVFAMFTTGVERMEFRVLNIAGDGTVQMLHPARPDAKPVGEAAFRLPVQVRRPYGADLVVAISSDQPLPQLEQSLRALNQRRSAVEALRLVERYRSSSLRIGAANVFTAP